MSSRSAFSPGSGIFPRFLAALFLVQAGFCSLLAEAPQGPGWRFSGAVDASAFVAKGGGSQAEEQAGIPGAALLTGSIDADYPTEEIKELARSLAHDPLRIFNYVRSTIGYEHYFGCKKGAALTLLEASGNDFDQCSLLVSLLREAAQYNPAIGGVFYKYGRITVPLSDPSGRDLSRWLGVTDTNQAVYLTVEGGWPAIPPGQPQPVDGAVFYADPPRVELARVWVELVIDGVSQRLDPSFKTYAQGASLNILAASGYDASSFLAQAGGTVTPTQISGLSVGSVQGYLSARTSDLATYLNSTTAALANSTTRDVIGGRQAEAINDASDFSDAMWFATPEVLETWEEIPGERASVLQLQAGGALTWTIPMAELRGRRLALTFRGTAPHVAQIWLDDALVAQETGSAPGTELEVTTSIQHPHLYAPHDASDAAHHKQYFRTGYGGLRGSYAILYGFNPGAEHLALRQRKLESYRASGLTDSSREVLTETLNVMGLQYLRQTELTARLVDAAADVLRVRHHSLGRMAQDKGFYVDVPLFFTVFLQRRNDDTFRTKAIGVLAHLWSALEHGVVEQQQGADFDAVSTVDLITRALANDEIVYRATPSTWAATVRPQLAATHSASQLSAMDSEIGRQATLLVPAAGNRVVHQWTGGGFASLGDTFAGMTITGNYAGGYASVQASASSFRPSTTFTTSPSFTFPTPASLGINRGADPVDLASGAFLYDHVDLQLGGAEPRGLAFARHYNTRSRRRNDAGLGYGWTHNYHLRLNKRSATGAGLGLGSPRQAAAAIAAVNIALDLFDTTDAKRWACALLACGWAVDQLYENSAAVQIGERTLEFIRLPDDTWVPPAGIAATLTQAGSNMELGFRHSNTLVFDSAGKGIKIRDPYGKELNLAYNGNGTLSTVTDCYNRVLTLGYSGSELTAVSDSTGRSVSYGHDGHTDLRTYTDPENKVWFYDYTSGHRLERTRDPDDRTIVENVYDAFDRVKEQRSFGDPAKTWKLFYTSNATVEEDPLGGQRTLLYDDKNRLVADIDASGRKMAYGYDGQDHRTHVTTPNGETAVTDYDAHHNPKLITDPLLKTTQLFYDGQERLDYTIDRRGKIWDTSFNASHQPWISRTPEGVETELLYYTSGPHAGLLWKKIVNGTDTTTYEYDANGYVNKITYPNNDFETFINNARGDVSSHTDLRGFVTGFSYNNRRQPLITTLPTVNSVSYYLENVYDNEGNLWK